VLKAGAMAPILHILDGGKPMRGSRFKGQHMRKLLMGATHHSRISVPNPKPAPPEVAAVAAPVLTILSTMCLHTEDTYDPEEKSNVSATLPKRKPMCGSVPVAGY
jgi:hypothetical protein